MIRSTLYSNIDTIDRSYFGTFSILFWGCVDMFNDTWPVRELSKLEKYTYQVRGG